MAGIGMAININRCFRAFLTTYLPRRFASLSSLTEAKAGVAEKATGDKYRLHP
ncbi:hypothetical protein KCP75_11220 [Salmonella enterica subsp. enterica]|nr:hypothetical protein KCP75_11220 [Salmonella enterica subsp. enterica]